MHDVVPILRRSVGIHRAAQLLAEAYACRVGQSPQPFADLDAADRAWFLQITEQIIGAFERQTMGATVTPAERRRAEREVAVQLQRDLTTRSVEIRGHALTPWAPVSPTRFDERAFCLRCHRSVTLTVTHHEHLSVVASGEAMEQGCIAEVVR